MKVVGGERPGASLVDTAQNNASYGRERRRAVRNAVHTPAYASLNGSAQAVSLELCEILNISESGTCIQAPEPLKVNRPRSVVGELWSGWYSFSGIARKFSAATATLVASERRGGRR